MKKLNGFKVKIIKCSHMPAFGAWCAESLKKKDGTVLLNVEACLGNMVDENGKKVVLSKRDTQRLIITTLMHEFGHALEEYFKIKHSELRVRRATHKFIYD